MKYSNFIGVATALALIGICFMPWVYISSIHLTVTGMQTGDTNLGKPGLMHVFLSGASIIFFLVQAVWAKRVNVFVGAFNFAWSLRNFLLVTQCQMGECPEKKAGIYLVMILSFVMLLMTLLPKVKLEN